MYGSGTGTRFIGGWPSAPTITEICEKKDKKNIIHTLKVQAQRLKEIGDLEKAEDIIIEIEKLETKSVQTPSYIEDQIMGNNYSLESKKQTSCAKSDKKIKFLNDLLKILQNNPDDWIDSIMIGELTNTKIFADTRYLINSFIEFSSKENILISRGIRPKKFKITEKGKDIDNEAFVDAYFQFIIDSRQHIQNKPKIQEIKNESKINTNTNNSLVFKVIYVKDSGILDNLVVAENIKTAIEKLPNNESVDQIVCLGTAIL